MSAAKPTSSPLPNAVLDDPQLQPLAKKPEQMQLIAAAAMFVGILLMVGFMVAFWIGNNSQWEAITLGGGMLFLGCGVIAWGKYLMPQGPFVEQRHDFHSTEEERESFSAAVTQRGTLVVKRRGLLVGMLGLGSAVLGLALAFPLIRSLGPKPSKSTAPTGTDSSLSNTNWTKGSSVVTVDGRRVKVDDLEVGGVLTVFPGGHEGNSPDQVILIRLRDGTQAPPGRTDWGVDGIVAFSKLCTHLGCPVGLYQQQTQQLVCPCHQSIFNVAAGCIPEFGPAPRPLPQLPISADASGYLRSTGGFDQPVGPGFWERP